MNKIIFFVFAFLLFPISNSFGAFQNEIGDDVFVFVQNTVRDSDGKLVLYMESTKFSYLDAITLNIFLDSEANQNDPIVTIDEKQFQVIRRAESHPFDKEDLFGATFLSVNFGDSLIKLVQFPHDGYNVVSGDTLETVWTFVRPVS